ncbi:MAG: hypothetical protein COB04_13320 [Gammaproteobacteria bacterium]|nr:MAG: hypothetical protein COB04_13320 [Gammaproteobacteria bacterium]
MYSPHGSSKKIWATRLLALTLWSGLTLSSPAYSAEDFYKWVDDKGITHYTRTPPTSEQQTSVITTSSSPSSDASKSKERLLRSREAFNTASETRKNESIVSPEEAKNIEIRSKNCEIATARLKNLQENVRLREKLENGEYQVITEDGRQGRITTTKKQVQDNCSPS